MDRQVRQGLGWRLHSQFQPKLLDAQRNALEPPRLCGAGSKRVSAARGPSFAFHTMLCTRRLHVLVRRRYQRFNCGMESQAER